jgi:membrane fusion protein (multidrug efflux system)
LQGSYQVAVVSGDDKVHIHTVQVGPQIGKDWVILSGLAPHDQVVIEGNGKLADGMPVHPKPAEPAQAEGATSSSDQTGSSSSHPAKQSAATEGK